MMKSWADTCSSDEESIDEIADELENQKFEEEPDQELHQSEEDSYQNEAPVERVYDFPDKPPFTAFVGNLAFSLRDAEHLKDAVANVAAQQLGQKINLIGGRIATDRRDGKPRGFGYVEVETLDELKLLMKLNDGEPMIEGRKIQVDTAEQGSNNKNNNNQRNSRSSFDRRDGSGSGGGDGGFASIDGSKFRGGRFNNDPKSNNNSDNNNRKSSCGSDAPAGQRPSLKLAPRTKPAEGKQGSASNIFGGAKARDAQAWEQRKRQPKTDEKKVVKDGAASNGDNGQDRRRSSQTGRGRGGKGRGGGGRGKGDNSNNANRKGSNARRNPQNQQSPEEKAAVAAATSAAKPATAPAAKPAAEPAPAPAPAKKEVTNKFALLMDSDSD